MSTKFNANLRTAGSGTCIALAPVVRHSTDYVAAEPGDHVVHAHVRARKPIVVLRLVGLEFPDFRGEC